MNESSPAQINSALSPEDQQQANINNSSDEVIGLGAEAARSLLKQGQLYTYEISEHQDDVLDFDDQLKLLNQGRDIAAHKEKQQLRKDNIALTEAASHDDLTTLLNRRGFISQMKNLLERSQSGQIGLLFIDLDNFKQINDHIGHEYGDRFLRHFGKWLGNALQHDNDSNLVARLGGDEFVIGVDLTKYQGGGDEVKDPLQDEPKPYDQLQTIGNTIEVLFTEEFIKDHPAVTQYEVGLSWGSAVWEPPIKLAKLLDMADAEMYSKKHSKPNRLRLLQSR